VHPVACEDDGRNGRKDGFNILGSIPRYGEHLVDAPVDQSLDLALN
jgi:hypothetical protein